MTPAACPVWGCLHAWRSIQEVCRSAGWQAGASAQPPAPRLPAQVEAKVQEALAAGAAAACGGRRPSWQPGSPLAGGFFYEPTVLTGACACLPAWPVACTGAACSDGSRS